MLSPQTENFFVNHFALFSHTSPLFQIWQIVSYGFLHGGIFHLLLNMYALYLFGSKIEMVWGEKRMIQYYMLCIVGAGLTQLAWQYFQQSSAGIPLVLPPTVGASGGVFGILFAYAVLFPNDEMMIFPIPIPIKAKWFVMMYAAFELYNGVTNTNSGVAHFAHLGGMLFGILPALKWSGKIK